MHLPCVSRESLWCTQLCHIYANTNFKQDGNKQAPDTLSTFFAKNVQMQFLNILIMSFQLSTHWLCYINVKSNLIIKMITIVPAHWGTFKGRKPITNVLTMTSSIKRNTQKSFLWMLCLSVLVCTNIPLNNLDTLL